MYATVADVRLAGAPAGASDAAITTALTQAGDRINAYTGDLFETTPGLTVRAQLANGLAVLPLRVQTVTAVTYADQPGASSLAITSYSVRSSARYGDIDAVQLNGYGSLAAVLDITLEPFRGPGGQQGAEVPVLVTGTFGWAVTPDAVHDAAVAVALTQLPGIPGGGSAGGGATGEVNVEGDADLGTAPTVPNLGASSSGGSSRGTTGSSIADALLAYYCRGRVRLT